MRARWLLTAVIVVAAGAAALLVILPERRIPQAKPRASEPSLLGRQRPLAPPVPGKDVPRPMPEPEMPPEAKELSAKAYAAAVAAGNDRPGDMAFRATVDAFIKYNQAFAEAQAKEEGITIAEVHELTYFGFLVMQTQRWTEIEELVGRELSEEEREQGELLMQGLNSEFKDAMRALVARGASQDERWALIRETQAHYKEQYFALTGMNDKLLDDLLAGDITRPGAPATTPIPEDIEPAEYVPPAPRPAGEPK